MYSLLKVSLYVHACRSSYMNLTKTGFRSHQTGTDMDQENLIPVLQAGIGLVFRSHLSPSLTCLEKLFCEEGENMSRQGGISYVLAEVFHVVIAKNIPGLTEEQRLRLMRAGGEGRKGEPCSRFKDCEDINWSFINNAAEFSTSTVGNYKHIYNLINWVYNKI